MGILEGKVAFVTGAARGQGRSHAVRLAQEGADIIAVDLCDQIPSVPYPMSTPEDLAETVRQVEAVDRRIVAYHADVRDLDGLTKAFEAGVSTLGPVDIVLGNAGIAPMGSDESDAATAARLFRDVIDTNLVGVWNTLYVSARSMLDRDQGGAIVLTSSTQGLSGRGGDGSAAAAAYTASKHGVVGLMRSFANWLSPHNIRVNTVNPTAAATPMAQNAVIDAWVQKRPGGTVQGNLMPVGLIEAVDVSNAILWLVSDAARYVTGVALPVDAGFGVK
jgi:SDR family mycofactocin-dependent oxidoreductase